MAAHSVSERLRPAFRALAEWGVVVLPAVAVAALLDGAMAYAGGGGARSFIVAMLVVLGVFPLLLPLALLPSLIRRIPKWISPYAAECVGGTLGGVLGLRVAEALSASLFLSLRRADLAGLILALTSAGLTLASIGLGVWLGRSFHRRWPSDQFSRFAPWICVGIVLAWFAWRMFALDLWGHVGWRLVFALGALVSLIVVQTPFERHVRWARSHTDAALLATLIVPFASWAGAFALYPTHREPHMAIELSSVLTRQVLTVARGFVDMDGDGYSSSLGGGDCDDDNADIHPMAVDVPGDGIDQDCLGGDTDPVWLTDPFGRGSLPVRLSPGASRPTFRSAVFIVLDAVRFDATGAGETGASSTPNLDRVAEGGAVFTQTWAPAPGTWPSIPSCLTGRYALSLQWNPSMQPPALGMKNTTLPEVLSRHGFRTAGLVSLYMAEAFGGLGQGFEVFGAAVPPGASPDEQDDTSGALLARAKAVIRGLGLDRTFLYIQFTDAHFPYRPRPGIETAGDDKSRYLGEVRYVDKHVGELLSFLSEQPGADETLLILTADHGEEFQEHGGRFHATQLYEESLRVPLVLAGRGLPHAKHSEPVSLVDLMPTVLDLLGVPPTPELRFDGRTLAPDLSGTVPEGAKERLVFADLEPWQADPQMAVLANGNMKLLVRRRQRVIELYDLARDPHEQRSLADENSAEAELLAKRISLRWSLSAQSAGTATTE